MKIIVIGHGMVGHKFLETLADAGAPQLDVTVLCEEARPAYDRVHLSEFFSGKSADELSLVPPGFFERGNVLLKLNARACAIDRAAKTVTVSTGEVLSYDKLVLATGSYPFVPPVPGKERADCFVYRTIEDLEAMLECGQRSKTGVVIGGGLLGLEAANGLLRQGMEVTVVHVSDCLMNQQLDKPAALLLKKALEMKGLHFLLNAHTAEIYGPGRVTAVRFKDGGTVPADLVVMAVGVRPNIELAQASGLHCERGIVVDDTLQSYDPRVYSVGECVQHRRATFGLVAPIWEQARVCGAHLAGAGHRRYVQQATPTKLKVTGVDLYSVGDFIGGEGSEDLVLRDPRRGIYKRLVLKDDRVAGAVLYGDVEDGPWYFDLISKRTDISAMRDHLLFGKALCAQAA